MYADAMNNTNKFETLDTDSHMPYYVQIKYYLRQLIQNSAPNTLMPSEKELASKFGVSRGTAKQAIMDLVYEGILYRVQGKGTFTKGNLSRNYDHLPTFTKDIRRSGASASSVLLSFTHSAPAPRARDFFHLKDDETVIRYKRLVLDNDQPNALVISYLNGRLYKGLKGTDIGVSLYETLDKKFHAAPAIVHDTYSTAAISPKTAVLLQQPETAIVIYSERLSYLSDHTPVEFVESYIRADRFKIEVDYTDVIDSNFTYTSTNR